MSQQKITGLADSGAPEQNKKPRLLVVDDEPGWRDLLSYELRANGYEVELAENGCQGLEMFRQKPTDVILTDVRMPGKMDGIDMIQQCLEEGARPKVIFMSGYAAEEKLEKALRYESSLYLRKPFDMDELLKALCV